MGIRLIGAKEVGEALSALDSKLSSSVLRSFNRKSVKDKATIPWQQGAISSRAKSNIKISSIKGSKTAVEIGPGSDTYWERFLQMGTQQRQTAKGWNRGSMRGDFKLEQAAENTIDPLIDYVNENLGKEVEKILRQKLKTTGKKLGNI